MTMTSTMTMTRAAGVETENIPRHIAIIMDGNGRWAKREGVTRAKGHEAGAKAVRAAIETCRELERVETLSLYAFSTENWQRSKTEVTSLFRLLSKYIKLEIDELNRVGVRVAYMGRREGLSKRVLDDMEMSIERTKNNTKMLVNVGINYGGRIEIVDACRAIAREVKAGSLKVDAIDEACVARHLYVPETAEVDLLIRTSGEMRLSNFMLWQVSYAELYVTPALWPDFRKADLLAAIREYQSRHRRFGAR
jgi:undecaprenyl diphosphate synthase